MAKNKRTVKFHLKEEVEEQHNFPHFGACTQTHQRYIWKGPYFGNKKSYRENEYPGIIQVPLKEFEIVLNDDELTIDSMISSMLREKKFLPYQDLTVVNYALIQKQTNMERETQSIDQKTILELKKELLYSASRIVQEEYLDMDHYTGIKGADLIKLDIHENKSFPEIHLNIFTYNSKSEFISFFKNKVFNKQVIKKIPVEYDFIERKGPARLICNSICELHSEKQLKDIDRIMYMYHEPTNGRI